MHSNYSISFEINENKSNVVSTTIESILLSRLEIYNSTSTLSSRFADYFNVYFLPSVCFIGVVSNLITIVILARPNLKGDIYQYMLLNTIVDLVFVLICIFTVIFRCGIFCSYAYTYWAKLYEKYIFLYVGNICLLFGGLLYLKVSISRLGSFSHSQKRCFLYEKLLVKFASSKMIALMEHALLLLVSVIVNYVIYIIPRHVRKIGLLKIVQPASAWSLLSNETNAHYYERLFSVQLNPIGNDQTAKLVIFIITIARGFFLLCLILVLNVILCYKFRRHINAKKAITLQKMIQKQGNLVKLHILYIQYTVYIYIVHVY
jgi:hypothetical protein